MRAESPALESAISESKYNDAAMPKPRASFLLLCLFAFSPALAQSKKAATTESNLRAATAAFRAGSAAYQHNDLRTAHAEFAKLVRLEPQVAAGHSAFGTVLLAEGDLHSAAKELAIAHKLDPRDTSAMLGLAMAWSQLARYKEAIGMFSALARESSSPLPANAVINWAAALAAGGHTSDAQAKLTSALKADPQNAQLHDALGSLLARQAQFDAAESEFRRAITLDSS